MNYKSCRVFVLALVCIFTLANGASVAETSEEDDGEIEIVNIDEEFEAVDPGIETSLPTKPPPSSEPPPQLLSSRDDNAEEFAVYQDDIVANNTRCSQTHLSFTKETLLHVWEIKGLIGYMSYIKRFEQPFEIKTEQVSFKSDNVDGKWIFKLHKVRNSSPFSLRSSALPLSTSASAASVGYGNNLAPGNSELGDIRIVATYSYEAKQPRNIDFVIKPTIIHGSREIALPARKSTSPTIIQQKFYNTRGYQLNSNFLEYVYTFNWPNIMQSLNSIKSNLLNTNLFHDLEKRESGESPSELMQKQQPAFFLHDSETIDDASEELFEEITKTDFLGHFGDITVKFLISAYFPEEPVTFTSSRCNSSVLQSISHNLLEKLTVSSSFKRSLSSSYSRKDFGKQHRAIGSGLPPYLRYSYSMLHDDRFADVLLVVGEEQLPAHKIILATSSPVFSAILENTTAIFSHPPSSTSKENLTDCNVVRSNQGLFKILIEPHDIGVDSVEELLRYIYTGTVDSLKMRDNFMVRRLIIIADRYGLPELKRYCESLLLQSLTPDNAIEIYLLGARVSSEKMTRKALIVMKLNKAKVASQTEDFRELSMRHPTLMFDLFLSD